MKNKGLLSIIGFLLFLFGFLSILLSVVGIKLVFLQWVDAFGRGFGLLFKLLMVIAGFVVVIVARGDEAQHDEYLPEE